MYVNNEVVLNCLQIKMAFKEQKHQEKWKCDINTEKGDCRYHYNEGFHQKIIPFLCGGDVYQLHREALIMAAVTPPVWVDLGTSLALTEVQEHNASSANITGGFSFIYLPCRR